ncbi:hypothetical protein [Luteolibacter luteus]|uniref:Uncharacterized protein n=1 Tax=Luteolibacter luteus TaxID=2728835 RepID=A0A858RLU8_9BACT|nr:hypothetical protein [Luteolibacter luteus]QJE97438.1 hypothetical protein HHL09_17150 [Luteolibacter luteus]
MQTATSRPPSLSGEGRKEPDRISRERTWRHAKELTQEEAAETVVSPVFLGYLQSDPSDTKLRIGLRQESGEKVDPSELVVNVDLLDREGKVIPGENEVSAKWETGDKTFEETALPVLRVDSQTAIAGVSVSLSYKGQQIEQRRYSLERH